MYDGILGRIGGLRRGNRGWFGRCPCVANHKNGDRSGSLMLWISEEDGSLRCKCFKGCKFRDIAGELGTKASEWFPPSDGLVIKFHGGGAMAGELVATYDYVDEGGGLLFQACKLKRDDGSKSFFQRRPMPDGGWANTLGAGWFRKNEGVWYQVADSEREKYQDVQRFDAVRIVPFRLPSLLAHPEFPVIVVEGEKDVLTLEEVFAGCKVCVTTNPMGAKKWPWHFGKYLKGRRVTIIPDYDDPGFEHACLVAANGIAFGAESVRVVQWPEGVVKCGGDVTDWLEAKHAGKSPSDKRAAIAELVKGVNEYHRKAAT